MCHSPVKLKPRSSRVLSDPAGEVPGKKDILPFTASNKRGTPVTRLLAIITLNDRLPAFTIQTATLGNTPHLTGGIGGLGNARVPVQTRGDRKFVSLPGAGVRGNGGVLFLPKKGSNTIRLYTWNVENLSLSRNISNQSHAEKQFLNWFTGHAGRYPEFVRRVRRIQLFLNNSPCGGCTEDLCYFAKRYKLQSKVSIFWSRAYNKGTSSADNRKKLEACRIHVRTPLQQEMLFEASPQLRNIKVEKQQAHTYLLDKRVHSDKPNAVNRRVERLLKDQDIKPVSLLSRVLASPHNRSRVKRLFQRAIEQGNFKPRKGGGYESTITFKHPTGWSYGKQVNRLKAIVDQAGNWHYYPVP